MNTATVTVDNLTADELVQFIGFASDAIERRYAAGVLRTKSGLEAADRVFVQWRESLVREVMP